MRPGVERPASGGAVEGQWGCELLPSGGACFRVWAPGVTSLALRLEGEDIAMPAVGDGWFELAAERARPGMRYAFVLDDGLAIPDPAARAQAGDVHGPSLIVDPGSYRWRDAEWRGRPWEEAVIYELHVGTFTPEGTFRAAIERLDHLAALGVTAVEIMPVAQFSGDRGWGYDGVLAYAPHSAYGSPDDMKALVDAAHERGLMVLLDVVYNHFGPDGNYLPLIAPDFFHSERQTPWGAAIAYERAPVRRFFTDNALYWLTEFHLDGFRFDAVDQIRDTAEPELLVEIARRIREECPDRPIHLCTEDNRNITRLHERGADGGIKLYSGEWNDDFHNVAHVLLTGETDSYYEDFKDDSWRKLAKSLAEGFVYQGELSVHAGEERGVPSGHLPPAAFVDFLQNHDQIGNRAFGDRLTTLADPAKLRLFQAILLLSPHIPLLFMGEEWGETRPFCFFTDFHGELADAVREGRRKEFAKFSAFASKADWHRIPDPNAASTFESSKLDWDSTASDAGREAIAFMRNLLDLRRRHVVPLLAGAGGHAGRVVSVDDGRLVVEWQLGGARLRLAANFTKQEIEAPAGDGRLIFAEPTGAGRGGSLPPRSVVFELVAGG